MYATKEHMQMYSPENATQRVFKLKEQSIPDNIKVIILLKNKKLVCHVCFVMYVMSSIPSVVQNRFLK